MKDKVVPIMASREYTRSHLKQVKLIEVYAGHDINAHLPLIWEWVQQLLADDQS